MSVIEFLVTNQAKILTTLLALSELLAFLFPNSGGIIKSVMAVLKNLGAKQLDQK